MEEPKISIEEIEKRFSACAGKLDLGAAQKKITELEQQSGSSDFWQDSQKARRLMEELAGFKEDMAVAEGLKKRIDDLKVMAELGMMEEYEKEIGRIEKEIEKLELKTFLSGQYDNSDAIMTIRAGQGGTEAMDWTEILERMYLRYAERRGWNTDIVDLTRGDEAGVKSITLQIYGAFAYGYLKREAGVHRLVRQSPFNADKLRQTSFAQVEVLPVIEEGSGIEINPDDLELEFSRSSSHGGQNVQKVSTAVRIRHKPTGIVITSQSERFQERNRKIAMDLLRSKLWELQKLKQKKQEKELRGEHVNAGWGNQIRSYVLHPYKMVKDLRTGVEVSNPEKVLDGDLEIFIEAELKSVI